MKIFTQLTRALPMFRSNSYERAVVRLAAGSVGATVAARSMAALKRVRRLRRVLLIADVNIGDAILLQPAIAAFRHRFPGCQVDYVFSYKMATLLGPDPEIHTSFPVLRGGSDSTPANLDQLRQILRNSSYDLVVSFCPFVTARQLGDTACPVITPLGFAIELLRAVKEAEIAAMPYRVASWIDEMAASLPAVAPTRSAPFEFPGTRVFLSSTSIQRGQGLVHDLGVESDGSVIFVNPDTSNYSTHLGVEFHVELVQRLLGVDSIGAILLGRGYSYPGIEHQIMDALGRHHDQRLQPVPKELSLDDLAALIDRCAAYVGGDTGPLHIAAARKIDPTGATKPANRLAVIGVFKATEPRIYGYDSHRPDMIDSSQDAVAVTVEERPRCKNLTCSMQRISSSCPAVECHDLVNPELVADRILRVVSEARTGDLRLAVTGTIGS
jgi:ADP-heptose:LPS heptosyltransferase